jgi:hypothetical protein
MGNAEGCQLRFRYCAGDCTGHRGWVAPARHARCCCCCCCCCFQQTKCSTHAVQAVAPCSLTWLSICRTAGGEGPGSPKSRGQRSIPATASGSCPGQVSQDTPQHGSDRLKIRCDQGSDGASRMFYKPVKLLLRSRYAQQCSEGTGVTADLMRRHD